MGNRGGRPFATHLPPLLLSNRRGIRPPPSSFVSVYSSSDATSRRHNHPGGHQHRHFGEASHSSSTIASHALSMTEEAMSSLAGGGNFVTDLAVETVVSDIAHAVADTNRPADDGDVRCTFDRRPDDTEDNDTKEPAVDEKTQLWMQLTKQLEDEIRLESENYRRANERSCEINAALVRCEMARDASGYKSYGTGMTPQEDDDLDKLVIATVVDPTMYNNIAHDGGYATGEIEVHPKAPRLGGLGHKMEDYSRYKAFHHFLSEGSLLSPNAACFFVVKNDIRRNLLTDEEYLGGACIGLCHDLAKHVVTRATMAVDDVSAVPFIRRCRDAVSLILEGLLLFDFRNGPLRRKYDGTKYALKTIETVLYELSVAGAVGGHESLMCGGSDDVGPSKRRKVDQEYKGATEEGVAMQDGGDESSIVYGKEMAEIRERMDRRDQQREIMIKTCRDGQKAAKQAIFAVHRGDFERASKLLKECESCINDKLLPILDEDPTLRYGSFSCLLEEYVEGILFYTWLQGDEGGGGNGCASGRILLPDDIPVTISTEDYLGGLCDLTGEIGRYAVARGTVRDKDSVRLCLESNKSIYMTLKMLGKIPPNINKKVGMVSNSVEKLERLLYEQSLMIMTGRKEFTTGVEETSWVVNNKEDN